MFRGFFNRMYQGNPNKPDLNPEDMPKNRFELFFTTLGLRFGDLIKLNLIFVMTLLPIIIWSFLTYYAINVGFDDPKSIMGIEAPTAVDMANYMMHTFMIFLLGLLIFLPLSGPPLAGLTYVARNYARDEHAWLWSDFKEHMKKNWKQSVAVMFILGLAIYLSAVTLQLYSAMQSSQPTAVFFGFMTMYVNTPMSGGFMWIMQLLFIVFACLFMLSYIYVFPMLVTYKLKVGQILRNSLMLALGRLPFTLLFGVIALFPLLLAAILSINFIMAQNVVFYIGIGLLLYYLLLGFSLTAFILNSYTNATFDKLMKAEEDEPKDDGGREVKP